MLNAGGSSHVHHEDILQAVASIKQRKADLVFIDDPPYYLPNDSVRRKHHLGPKPYRPHKLSKLSSSGAMVRGRRVGGNGLSIETSQGLIDEFAVPTKVVDTVVESTSDSNSDSFRGVIDDLTIKSKFPFVYYFTVTATKLGLQIKN